MSILPLTSIDLRDLTFKELTKGYVVRLSTMGKRCLLQGSPLKKYLSGPSLFLKCF